jgi:hypothetical protein
MKVAARKADAAVRQLTVAIQLLFADSDPLAVRTLSAAAHAVLSDLVEHKKPGGSWRSKMVEDCGLPKGEALRVLNGASNFLKHADRDPEELLEFEEEETDHLIFFATLECGELGHKSSTAMQAFQIWYLAVYPDYIGKHSELAQKAQKFLPGIDKLEREERLKQGSAFVARAVEHYGWNLTPPSSGRL